MINFIHYRKKKKKKLKFFLVFISIILLSWVYYIYTLNQPVSYDATLQTFTVQSGWGSRAISRQLKNANLIRNAYIFQLYIWRHGVGSKLQIGEYNLSTNLSIKEIAQILSRGTGETKEVTLTFIEGWNNDDLASYLVEKRIANSVDFLAVVQKKSDWWDDYRILDSKPRNLDLEGYLFPDTYRVFRDASLSDIVRKMLDNLDSKLTEKMKKDITAQDYTIHEIITLASIIEKEVHGDADRKVVADIFYKRLEAGIALQSDATVNYATGKNVTRASASDLEIDSLYNTYKYRDLPPGPISNPSLSSIMAAIYPTPNEYYYFLTTPDGKVIYNKTFEEHIADKNKYY